MSHSPFQSIPQDKFLLLAADLLHKAFVESSRAQAKRVYKELVAGGGVNLTTPQLPDTSRGAFRLSLAHSEFRGSLSFGAFRASVTELIGNIARALREERKLKVFNALNGGSAMIFGVTALTLEQGERNVMVLAADTSEEGEAMLLQLMYLDAAQFAAPS
jgi:hypothetical protein